MIDSKIPATMMTQHPDACKYISIQKEPEEAIFSLTPQPKGLGIEEAMVDFEGKLTPYQQTHQIVLGLLSKGIIPGKEVFVTPRIPSGREEGVFRQLMALMSIVESNYHAWKKSKIYAVREVILPMTTGVKELLAVRERIIDVIELAHKEFGLSKDPNIVQLIPLVETMPQILKAGSLLEGYIVGCKKRGLSTRTLRYMIGRSDLALSYGLVSSTLSNKIAISQGYAVAKKKRVSIAPILGGGTLPFRGHFNLENIQNVIKEFSGVRTLTIQSAMRYDHGYNKTKKLTRILKAKLPLQKPLFLDEKLSNYLINLTGIFTKHYLETFYLLFKQAVKISDLIPGQRDRLTRKGEVGYARELPRPHKLAELVTEKDLATDLKKLKPKETVELPRAISYTASLYSLGLPPEIIGTGRGIQEVVERYGERGLKNLLKIYPSLKEDLSFACRFVHLDNASEFLPTEAIAQVEKDLKFIWRHLNIKIGAQNKKEKFYATILETMKPMLKELVETSSKKIISDEDLQYSLVKEWILKLGTIRGALG